jgi:hypothetical protein
MAQMGLQTKGRRRFRTTTQRDERQRRALNVLAGDFGATQLNVRSGSLTSHGGLSAGQCVNAGR